MKNEFWYAVLGVAGTLAGTYLGYVLENRRNQKIEKKDELKFLAVLKKEYDYYNMQIVAERFELISYYLQCWSNYYTVTNNPTMMGNILHTYRMEKNSRIRSFNLLVSELHKPITEFETYYGKDERFKSNIQEAFKLATLLHFKIDNFGKVDPPPEDRPAILHRLSKELQNECSEIVNKFYAMGNIFEEIAEKLRLTKRTSTWRRQFPMRQQ